MLCRFDAGYTSTKAQKSTRSLHAHSQLFVQCLHQHTPLHSFFEILEQKNATDTVHYYLTIYNITNMTAMNNMHQWIRLDKQKTN